MDLPAEVETNELTAVLDGRWAGLLHELRAQMAGVEPHDGSGLSTEEYRRQILDDLHLLAKSTYSRLAVNALGEELRPHAQTLVDAFAIPAPYLRAPSLDGGELAG